MDRAFTHGYGLSPTLGSGVTLPPIPALRGEENPQEWKSLLLHTLEFHNMASCVLKTSAEVSKTNREKAYAFILILQSISQVRDRLANAGWDFNTMDQDPKDLYDLILRTIPNTGAAVSNAWAIVGGFVHNFTHTKPSKFTSFEAYHAYVQYSKQCLSEVNCAVPDKLAICIVLNALKEYNLKWYSMLARQVPGLTWSQLMQEMGREALRREGGHGSASEPSGEWLQR
ncbi:hypothetical protein CONLIGDRAFT_682212 [Coniochaeta ligniaria NRRL 30616]|uniref:Uncharacterized protein n=1 Tax=Coniochaeta ligniaria NRRL 30616 TaxID=1408157 RepID=A0A1J7IIE3_9PEZI|nr:hypothetical protein CONLIGDRAFT_682212 [Coniochaeta ligniaria NRRL 30616]